MEVKEAMAGTAEMVAMGFHPARIRDAGLKGLRRRWARRRHLLAANMVAISVCVGGPRAAWMFVLGFAVIRRLD